MKETYFFSHDYNARTDVKIKNLIRKHGMLGYGIYWSIVEDLYNNANALQTNYESIAYDLRIDENVAKSIINDFDLFVINNGLFGSLSVQSRLDKRAEKSKRATDSANIRWGNNANAMQTQSDSNALKERKGKENKGNDIKVNKSIIERSQDFYKSLTPFLEIYNEELIQKFHLYWTEHGERDKKMRFEKEKSFGISRRLSTWKEKEKSFAKKENNEPKINRQTKEVIESNRNWQ